MSKLKEIYDGWTNYITSNPEVLPLADNRAKICAVCEFNKKNFCGKCGCFLPAKVSSPTSTCPEKKW
jgi:hypothetical protein